MTSWITLTFTVMTALYNVYDDDLDDGVNGYIYDEVDGEVSDMVDDSLET